MKTFLMILGLCAGVMGGGSQAQDLEVASATCEGKPSLYNPDDGNSRGVFGSTSIFSFLQRMPVAFASSGDQCLGPIPIYSLSLHDHTPALDTYAMARRLAPEMQAFSKNTGEEACARMCKTPAGLIVAQLVTLHSHISCLAPEDTCPAGSLPTPETIHSHPPHTAFEANAVDALGWDDPAIAGKLTLTGYPNSLSPDDRRQAPVWMVGTRGQLVWLDKPDGKEIERP